jgi:hypothetical protein
MCNKARALVELGVKPIHAHSLFLEVLANLPPPIWVALKEWSDCISTILPDQSGWKDMQELIKFLHACNIIFQYDSARYALETHWGSLLSPVFSGKSRHCLVVVPRVSRPRFDYLEKVQETFGIPGRYSWYAPG